MYSQSLWKEKTGKLTEFDKAWSISVKTQGNFEKKIDDLYQFLNNWSTYQGVHAAKDPSAKYRQHGLQISILVY